MKTKVYYNKKYSKSEIFDLISLSFERMRDSFIGAKSIELSHLYEMALDYELSKLLYGDIND